MEHVSGKGGAIQIEEGRKEVDWLFPFCGIVVDDVLDYLWCFWGKGYSFILSILSLNFLCSLILNLNQQKRSRWNGTTLLTCFP